MTECYDRAAANLPRRMPRASTPVTRGARDARGRSPSVTLVPGARRRRRRHRAPTTVPLETVGRHRSARRSPRYETRRRSRPSSRCRRRSRAVENAAGGRRRRPPTLGRAFARHERVGRGRGHRHASANGDPRSSPTGSSSPPRSRQTLVDTSTAYAKAAKQSSSMPTAPRKFAGRRHEARQAARRRARPVEPARQAARSSLDRGNKVAPGDLLRPDLRAGVARRPARPSPAPPATSPAP